MPVFRRLWAVFLICVPLAGCGGGGDAVHAEHQAAASPQTFQQGPAVPGEHAQPVSRENVPDSGGHSRQLSDLRAKYRQVFIMEGSAKKRQVALTFDDAPDNRFTPQVLDMLKRNGVKATFFIVGSRADQHPAMVRRIVREGHVIGNHSYNHPNFQKLGNTRFRNEVLSADRSIRAITGQSPRLVRPPYGNITEEQIKWLASRNCKIINWNVDSLDWKGLSAREVAHNVLSQTRPGSIILQHAGGGRGEDLTGTVQALPVIIRKLRDAGIDFVTVPELLGIPAY